MNCETCGMIFMGMNELRRHSNCEKHRDQETYNFSCLPCSLPLHTIPDVQDHLDSVEHYILALAADNPFDSPVGNSDRYEPFPPLYFCMLCGCRDGNPYGTHLKSVIHKNIARLVRAILSEKTIHYTNDGFDKELFEKLRNPNGPVYCELCNNWSSNWYNYKGHLQNTIHVKTQEFMNKLINVKQCMNDPHICDEFCYSFPFACELCNIHFNCHEYYNYHKENQTHKMVERFMHKISHMVAEMDVIIRSPDLKILDTFSNSLPPLYYCELCDLFCYKFLGYKQHKEGFIHKRIEDLYSKLSDKRKGNAIRLNVKKMGPEKLSSHYCKLCILGFPNTTSFALHSNDKGHLRIQQFINTLTNDGDLHFINTYIDAQIHMMYNDTPFPNYCELCNILHPFAEKYEQHLQSDEHKLAVQLHIGKGNSIDDCGDNSSKRLNAAIQPPSPENALLNVDNSNSVGNVHQNKNPIIGDTAFAPEANATNNSYPPWPSFVSPAVYSSRNYSPWIGFEAPATNNPPPMLGYQYHVPYGNYSPWPRFQAPETYGYYPPLPDFHAHVTNRNYPPWPVFRPGVANNNYPPWPSFPVQSYAANSYNPPWSGFETRGNNGIPPPAFSFGNPESSFIVPPGTEVLGSNIPPQQEYEDSSSAQLAETDCSESPQEHYCELCSYLCSNARHYDKHLKGEKHKKLRKLLNKKEKKNSYKTPTCENSGHPLQYNCELCDVFNPNAQQYELHLGTPKHKRNQWLLYVLMQRPL